MPIDLLGSLKKGFTSIADWVKYPGPSSDNDLLISSRKDGAQILNQSTRSRNLLVCAILSKRFALPTEIAEDILDKAESWLCQFDLCRRDWSILVQPICVVNNRKMVAFSKQLGLSEIKKLRRVRFIFVSKDQGWSDQLRRHGGTFEGSSSWWEMRIQRMKPREEVHRTGDPGNEATTAEVEEAQPHAPSLVSKWENVQSLHLQSNRHAGEQMERYNIDVDSRHEVFECLQPGDRIVLFACAEWPGWSNNVELAVMVLWFKDTLD